MTDTTTTIDEAQLIWDDADLTNAGWWVRTYRYELDDNGERTGYRDEDGFAVDGDHTEDGFAAAMATAETTLGAVTWTRSSDMSATGIVQR